METLESSCTALLGKLEGDLLNIRLEHPHVGQWAKASVLYLEDCLQQLRGLVSRYPFQTQLEECWFFKEVKAVVMGKMVFMCRAHSINVLQPVDKLEADAYLTEEIEIIEDFFFDHEGWYEYYKTSDDHLDHRLFVRRLADRFSLMDLPFEVDPVYFYGEPGFSTGFDYLFAQFRGYEQLRDHLETELEVRRLTDSALPPKKIRFTGSQADFVGLIEIFKNMGTPTNPVTGKPATDEELFEFFKSMLNPDVPEGMSFETLRLISGDSDIAERMADAMEMLSRKWDEEAAGLGYPKNDDDQSDDEDGSSQNDGLPK